MIIKHMQKCVLCVQAIVLYVLYKHVRCSMCPKHEPQQHSEVQSGCGCSPVVSVFNMCLSLKFWVCQIRQQRFE